MEKTIKIALNNLLPALTGGKIKIMKPEQIKALLSLWKGEDTVCVLPSGYGKSLIFFVAPRLVGAVPPSYLKQKVVGKPLVLIISPLISLMEAHVNQARDYKLSALRLPNKLEQINLEATEILLGSPEFWTSCEGKTVLQAVSKRCILLVADEVHVAPKWYALINWYYSTYNSILFRIIITKMYCK